MPIQIVPLFIPHPLCLYKKTRHSVFMSKLSLYVFLSKVYVFLSKVYVFMSNISLYVKPSFR